MVSQYLTYRQQRAAVLPARVDGVVVAVAADGVPQLGQLGVGVPGRGRVDPRVVAVDGAHRVAAGEGEGQHLVLQKVPSEDDPKVRNHGEGPY